MYTTVAQLVKDGKRIGFVFNIVVNQSLTQIEMLDEEVKTRLLRGEQFDIYFSGTKFYFKDNRKITDLPVVRKINTFQNNSNVVLDIYTGKKLKKFVQANIGNYKERDFVRVICNYTTKKLNRVLAISGLRGTGKTTGLLQAISDLNDYDRTVFISVDEKADMDCLDLRKELLKSKYKNKKYIFIDEITRINGFVKDSGFLADRIAMNGKKVIISGTDSLGLVKSEGSGLYHRILVKNVTQITYKEAKRTLNQTLDAYIVDGGLYHLDEVNSLKRLQNYVDTAVVDNILNTLTKNDEINSLLGIVDISKEKLRTIVFRILYAVIYCNLQSVKPTSVLYFVNLFDIYKDNTYEDKRLNKLVCDILNIKEQIDTNITEVKCVLSALEELGILVKAENLYHPSEYNYYITNPSIANQIALDICKNLSTEVSFKKKINTKSYKGLVFESIVVSHTIKLAEQFGLNVYYYHDAQNREIDLIVANEEQYANKYYLYEIKLTDVVDIAVLKSKWLCDEDVAQVFNGEIKGRAILYRGKTQKFTGFMDRDLQVKPSENLAEIEKARFGVDLISAEDFLLNLKQIYDKIEY